MFQDPKGTCDSSNGSALDANLLLVSSCISISKELFENAMLLIILFHYNIVMIMIYAYYL